MARRRPKALTQADLETQRQLRRDQEDKDYLAKARVLLRAEVEAESDTQDTQDRRLEAIYEAVPYAKMFVDAQTGQANAKATYRVGLKLGNKPTMEGAENAMRDSLRMAEIARGELERVLPLCHSGMLVGLLGQNREWQYILMLPKDLRDLIGQSPISDSADSDESLRSELSMFNEDMFLRNGAQHDVSGAP